MEITDFYLTNTVGMNPAPESLESYEKSEKYTKGKKWKKHMNDCFSEIEIKVLGLYSDFDSAIKSNKKADW